MPQYLIMRPVVYLTHVQERICEKQELLFTLFSLLICLTAETDLCQRIRRQNWRTQLKIWKLVWPGKRRRNSIQLVTGNPPHYLPYRQIHGLFQTARQEPSCACENKAKVSDLHSCNEIPSDLLCLCFCSKICKIAKWWVTRISADKELILRSKAPSCLHLIWMWDFVSIIQPIKRIHLKCVQLYSRQSDLADIPRGVSGVPDMNYPYRTRLITHRRPKLWGAIYKTLYESWTQFRKLLENDPK